MSTAPEKAEPQKTEAKPEAPKPTLNVLYKALCFICGKRWCYYVLHDMRDADITPLCGGHCAEEYRERTRKQVAFEKAAREAADKLLNGKKEMKDDGTTTSDTGKVS